MNPGALPQANNETTPSAQHNLGRCSRLVLRPRAFGAKDARGWFYSIAICAEAPKALFECQPGASPQEFDCPRIRYSAESAIQFFNPRHSARQNRCHACAATHDILPEKCESDGALVAYRRIPAPHRADLGSPKTRHSPFARKSRDNERQLLSSIWKMFSLFARRIELEKEFAAASSQCEHGQKHRLRVRSRR